MNNSISNASVSDTDKFVADQIFAEALKNISKKIFNYSGSGVVIAMGAELEFYLHYDNLKSIRSNEIQDFFQNLKTITESYNIDIEELKAEDGPNQFEIHIRPHDNLVELCDKISTVRYILENEFNATIFAKPNITLPGNSLHFNVSLYSLDGENLFAKSHANIHYKQILYHSIGGLLKYMLESFAIFSPTNNCYDRYRAPVTHQIHKCYPINCSWGINNRTCAIRVPSGCAVEPINTRIEHRVVSSVANPHLSLAIIIWSLSQGIIEEIEPQDPIFGDAFDIQYEHLLQFPWDLREAMRIFENGSIKKMIDFYLQNRKKNIE